MDLTPSPAQQDIAQSTAEYLSKEVPIARVRAMAAEPSPAVVDDETWSQWAELGFFSLAVPESAGGLGLGLVEEFLVVQQFGRHLTPGPLVSTLLAAHVAHAAGLDELTGRLLGGSERVGLQVGETGFDASAGGLVLSVSPDGATLTEVVATTALASVDPLTRLSRIELGDPVATVHDELLQPRAWVLFSAMLLGVAEATQERSTAYAKVRHQFNQPIGAFQAVKHRCADMVTRCYVARAQLHLAGVFVAAGRPDARFQAASALILALDAARENSVVNVQNHGGIGFTTEHDAGVFVKRVVALEAASGSPADRVNAVIEPRRTIFA